VETLETIPGTGVRARVRQSERAGARDVVIGAADRLGVSQVEAWQVLRARLRLAGGAREIAVLLDGRPVAAAVVDERLRSSWPDALRALRVMGLPVIVMTGDSAERAGRTAGDEIAAGLGPEQKLERIEVLKAEGHRVLMVGDGVNDAAAMAASDVGIAVAGGADLASEVADMVWHGSDLRAIPWAVGLSRHALATIRSNLWLAASYNLAGIALAVAGLLHPVAAAVLMTCSSVVVTFRAIGGLHQDQREAEERSAAGARGPESAGRRQEARA
jgi:P-type E1-E2 ATPase